MADLTGLSNDELLALAGGAQPSAPTADLSALSNDELLSMAGGQDVPRVLGTSDTGVDSGGSFPGASIIEPLAAGASAVVAEPLAGLAGIAQSLFSEQEGAGAKAVESVRQSLTFKPRTQEGKDAIQEVAEFLAPVGEAIQDSEKFLGDSIFEATGSPTLAAAAATVPTAILEIIGLKGGGRLAKGKSGQPSKRQIRASLKEAAPEPEALFNIARGVYKELDQSGTVLKPQVYDGMVAKIEKAAKEVGLNDFNTPEALQTMRLLESGKGTAKSLTELDQIRQAVGNLSGVQNSTIQNIGRVMVDEIDDFMDNISPKALESGAIEAKDIGKKYNIARKIYSRAKKSETIQQVFKDADLAASGFENGIRIELKKIITNKKRAKFFSKEELDIMRDINKGDVKQNLAKLIGKFGLSEGRASNIIGAAIGAGGGFASSGLAGSGAVLAVGTVAKKVASSLTKGRTEFLDALIRSGNKGEEITKAYNIAVPKAKRSVQDLTDMLSDPSVDLTELFSSADAKVRELGEIALGKQTLGELSGVATVTDGLPKGEDQALIGIDPQAVELLRSNPALAVDFNATFGEGMAERALR